MYLRNVPNKNIWLIAITMFIILFFYSFQLAFLIAQNEELKKTNYEILKINTELKKSIDKTEEDNTDLKNEINGLKKEIKEIKRINGDIIREFEKIKRINEELMERTEKLNEIFFDKKRKYSKVLKEKTVFLTFDDGPSNNTEKILDILKEYNVKATFFVCGNVTEYGKRIYKRIVNEGHVIGNHTYSHNYKRIYFSEESFMKDFKKLEKLIYSVTGIIPEIMRFPGGSNTTIPTKYNDKLFMERITTKIILEGYQYFDWHVSSKDAEKLIQDKDIIIKSVLEKINNRNNAIILFHDSWQKTTTVEALPVIIEELIKKGYKFGTLSKDSPYIHFL